MTLLSRVDTGENLRCPSPIERCPFPPRAILRGRRSRRGRPMKPIDDKLRDAIQASVESGFDAQLAFTQEMIRFPSLRGAEHAIQDHVFRALQSRGRAMERVRGGGAR